MKYPLPEGTLTIPDHWRDESVNIFTISESEGTNLVVSRQKVPAELSPSEYLNQQLQSFDESLKEYTKLGKQSIEVDGAPGITVEYTFKSPEGVMHQLTTMLIKETQFLSLTFTHPNTMTDTQKEEFMSVVKQVNFADDSATHVN